MEEEVRKGWEGMWGWRELGEEVQKNEVKTQKNLEIRGVRLLEEAVPPWKEFEVKDNPEELN